MAIPTVRAVGDLASGGGNVTVTLPTHSTDDILLLFVETFDEAVSAPSGGWAAVADSPQSYVGTGVTRLSVFWLRATSAAMSNPTILDPGDHAIAFAMSFAGCIATGDPWNVTSGGATAEAANQTLTGATTTVADCLIVLALSNGRNSSAIDTLFSNWTNASLANLTERKDETNTQGNGGGWGVATGEKATAGNYGNTTVDVSNANGGGYLTIALMPPATADRFDFGTEPSNTVINATMTSCTVRAEDSGGSLDTSFTGNVTVALTVAGGANLGGTLTRAAVAGVATFNDLTVDKLGTYTLTATGSLTSTESASFNITADRFDFGTEPSNTVEGVTISGSPTVRAEDAAGNLDTNFTGNVTVAIDTNPGSGTLSGTLTRPAVAGVATFNDLSINNPGTGYTLIATGGLTSTVSATFNITLEAATQLAFGQQPTDTQAAGTITPAVTVLARNSENVTDTNYTADVVIALQTGTGVLSGTLTKAAVAGVATFDDLSINLTGTKTLRATSGALTLADSTSFDITSGTPTPDRTIMYARRRGR